jgi:hypothetical protein
MKKKKNKKKSNNIRLERAFLNFLVDSTSHVQVKTLLKQITRSQYRVLQEIATNVLAGNLSFLSGKLIRSATKRLRKLSKGTLSKLTLLKAYDILKPFILATLRLHDLR